MRRGRGQLASRVAAGSGLVKGLRRKGVERGSAGPKAMRGVNKAQAQVKEMAATRRGGRWFGKGGRGAGFEGRALKVDDDGAGGEGWAGEVHVVDASGGRGEGWVSLVSEESKVWWCWRWKTMTQGALEAGPGGEKGEGGVRPTGVVDGSRSVALEASPKLRQSEQGCVKGSKVLEVWSITKVVRQGLSRENRRQRTGGIGGSSTASGGRRCSREEIANTRGAGLLVGKGFGERRTG